MSDWHYKHHLNAHSPLANSPSTLNNVGLHNNEAIAGTASFGMSGVNANALLQDMSSLQYGLPKAEVVIFYRGSSYRFSVTHFSRFLHVL